MNGTRLAALGGVVLAGVFTLSACGTDNNSTTSTSSSGSNGAASIGVACAKGTVNASGSTAQANAMDAWKKNYQQACGGSTVNYQANGSGAGIQQFLANSTSFAGSDAPLAAAEHAQGDARCKTGKAVDLPMVVGPVGMVYNLPGINNLQLTPTLIASIFTGKIKNWNDPQIAAVNKGANLPSTAIQTFHRSDASGTTFNFTSFLHATAPSVWTSAPNKQWMGPGGQGAKGSAAVAQAVKSTPGTIAYVEYSFVLNSSLQHAKVQNAAGEFVDVSPQAVGKSMANAKIVGTGNDLTLQLDYAAKTPGAYPVMLVTYEITCDKGLPADQLALTKSFLTYLASAKGQAALPQGYAAMPDVIGSKVQKVVSSLS